MGTRTKEEPGVHEFTNSNLPPEQLRAMVVYFLKLKHQDLIRMVLGLTPEDQERFVHKVDQVRRVVLRSTSSLITLTKVLPAVGVETVELVAALGALCAAIGRLPSSAVLSKGLRKPGSRLITSVGLMDTMPGEYGHRPVSIKAFRTYPTQDLKEAKKVRITWVTSSFSGLSAFHRFFGKRSSCGKGYLTKTFFRSTV